MTEPRIGLVVTGHVDHGKSTVVGRLLADTGSLPEGKLAQVRLFCERNARPFEYAFLLDALKDEQAQGITIDSARIFFQTKKRRYQIIDAPGHVEFLKNMVSGAARAEAALLVVDALEGVRENSRRHGYLLSMLGIRQVVVLVNKMDLVGYARERFDQVVGEFSAFLAEVGVQPLDYVPVVGTTGENLASRGPRMPWYRGATLLEAMDRLSVRPPPVDLPLRIPVQGVYKFTEGGDNRRIVAGTIESGRLRAGDAIVFRPSGKKGEIRTIESFPGSQKREAGAGEATGFTLSEELYVPRGEIACLGAEPQPRCGTRLRASLFWLGKRPLSLDRDYILKLGTARATVRLEAVSRVIDASSLAPAPARDHVGRNEVADCVLALDRELAFDLAGEAEATSRFVLVDELEISGGGVIREALEDRQAELRRLAGVRDLKWETSFITAGERARRHGHRPLLLLVTGAKVSRRKEIAKELERRLFEEGRLAYYLGMGNLIHGLGADLGPETHARREYFRRLGEMSHILLDAGAILIVTAVSATSEDLATLQSLVGPERIRVAWAGGGPPSDIPPDLTLEEATLQEEVSALQTFLKASGILG